MLSRERFYCHKTYWSTGFQDQPSEGTLLHLAHKLSDVAFVTHTKTLSLTLITFKIVTLTCQCDDKQRPKHESTLTGAWWEEDLLDTTEALHELPVQFKSNIGKKKKRKKNRFNIRLFFPYDKFILTGHTFFSRWHLTFVKEASPLDAGHKSSRSKPHKV